MNKFLHGIVTIITVLCLMALTFVATVWGVRQYADFLGFSSPSSTIAASTQSTAIEGRLMRISAYCPCEICCGKWADGITASGKPAVGLIVAAPPNIPFGTIVDVPGYGICAVRDRGGAITGDRLDVLFATHAEAKEWGVQWLMVKEMK